MTTSSETDGLDHPALREIVDKVRGLSLENRVTLLKGLIPSVADGMSPLQFEAFARELRTKGERFYDAKEHPGQGRATRNVKGERELEGRDG